MTSCTVSLMLCRSPSVMVSGSIDNFDALTFLCNPTHSVRCWCFKCVDLACVCAPPCFFYASPSSCPCKGVAWPSPTFMVASYAIVAFSFLVSFYVASRVTCTSIFVASFLRFLENCVMHSLASSFFVFPSSFSISAASGARHSDGHASSMLKKTLPVAMQGSFIHYLVKSLHALI